VDPSRVFLCGYSAGSVAIKRVLDAHPKRFKGAWVLSPVAFPSEEALALTSAKFSMQCGNWIAIARALTSLNKRLAGNGFLCKSSATLTQDISLRRYLIFEIGTRNWSS
jgi:poly(3-hydroxybutyrate) depolymerase